MDIDPLYLEMSFEKAGIRNSLKRLKSLIEELAVEPLKEHQDALTDQFDRVQEIVLKRVAAVIGHWCQNKHDPVLPKLQDLMSDITNSRKSDVTLKEFYINAVTNAMHSLAPVLNLEVPDTYTPGTDELEYVLLELEETFEREGIAVHQEEDPADGSFGSGFPSPAFEEYPDVVVDMHEGIDEGDFAVVAELVAEDNAVETEFKAPEEQRSITVAHKGEVMEVNREINLNVLEITAEEAWHNIYGMMGYRSEYIQEKMLPRWQQNPEAFDQDRRFLYNLFMQVIRNSAGVPMVAGNYTFADGQMSIDQLWHAYYMDLSQNVGPLLAAASFDAVINQTWYRKILNTFTERFRNLSPIWLLALGIALVFDGLTTYVSLDQTPMDGLMVAIFTALITALFQIADLLVINYRKREFEADAMRAKYSAKFEQLTKVLEGLEISSESFVQFSLEKSRAQADWKAAEDSRKMARRGRYWSARIADINIIITAYGFAYLFLNAEEPMYALFQQLETVFVTQQWGDLNLWVFLMVGLATTVSFVINTAQRTEILGWSMRRLKNDA